MSATKIIKPKACKSCGSKFVPARPLASVCSPLCGLDIARKQREKVKLSAAKVERAEIKRRKEAIKTLPQLKKEAQHAFNTFVRLRDNEKPCICCGRPLGDGDVGGAFDCGHYRSVGSAAHLRFNENNAHAQRKYCNRWGAGRAVDYRIGLVVRIGIAAVEALESDNAPRKWSREELQAIKTTYTARARELLKDQSCEQ